MLTSSSAVVVLTRLDTGDQGTFGRLGPWFTGELPWRDNAPGVSCILPGRYKCGWSYSPKFRRRLYLVLDVPGRSGIRIHPANLMGDVTKGLKSHLAGCIALGERLGRIEGQRAILLSEPAVRRFAESLNYHPFTLEISG